MLLLFSSSFFLPSYNCTHSVPKTHRITHPIKTCTEQWATVPFCYFTSFSFFFSALLFFCRLSFVKNTRFFITDRFSYFSSCVFLSFFSSFISRFIIYFWKTLCGWNKHEQKKKMRSVEKLWMKCPYTESNNSNKKKDWWSIFLISIFDVSSFLSFILFFSLPLHSAICEIRMIQSFLLLPLLLLFDWFRGSVYVYVCMNWKWIFVCFDPIFFDISISVYVVAVGNKTNKILACLGDGRMSAMPLLLLHFIFIFYVPIYYNRPPSSQVKRHENSIKHNFTWIDFWKWRKTASNKRWCKYQKEKNIYIQKACLFLFHSLSL